MVRSAYGVTMVELLVVLSILGIVTAIAGLELGSQSHSSASNSLIVQLTVLRSQSLSTGRVQTQTMLDGDTLFIVSAYPDGRLLTNAHVPIDPFSGRPDVSEK